MTSERSRFQVIAMLCGIVTSCPYLMAEEPFLDPGYAALEQRGWLPTLLPGMTEVAFSHYGSQGDAVAYTRMLITNGLANMYDPGPSITSAPASFFAFLAEERMPIIPWLGWSYAQIGGSPTPLSAEVLAKCAPLDAAGVFHALQLGEWGYHFHELAANESWFKQATGDEYERLKPLLKPAGLKGYRTMPATRQAAYDELKAYFLERQAALGGRIISMTGHSHYEAYAAEWGAALVGVELGENIKHQQSKLAFLRGAARQWSKPFSVQVSPWFGRSCTSSGAIHVQDGIAYGLDAGHSLNYYVATWLQAWFAGAALVTPENSSAIFFAGNWQDGVLTEHGRKAQETFRFMRAHERGIPYTPVAVVLDHLCGYNAYQGKDWGVFTPSALESQPKTLFLEQLFPGSGVDDAQNPEAQFARPTPYGGMFDVILTPATADRMASYPVLLLTGAMIFDPATTASLVGAARKGSRILISSGLAKRETAGLAAVQAAGRVEVLDSGAETSVISAAGLQALRDELLPIRVSGDAVEYQINRNRSGWVIAVTNHAGVVKSGEKATVIDAQAIARVRLSCRFHPRAVHDWASGAECQTTADGLDITIPPGETRLLEFQVP